MNAMNRITRKKLLLVPGRLLVFFMFFVLIFSSCVKKSVEIPKGVLTREELVPVLVDIHLGQAAVGIQQARDSMRFSMADYSAYIFRAHHITKDQYAQSLSFYSNHPEMLNDIYQEVINELSRKQSEAERK